MREVGSLGKWQKFERSVARGEYFDIKMSFSEMQQLSSGLTNVS